MSYLHELGSLALWSRLRLITDKLVPAVERIYRDLDIDFEPRWFAVTHYLASNGSARLTDISNALGLSHPSIVQVVNRMEKKGIARRLQDRKDRRATTIKLSAKGENMVAELTPVWNDISCAVDSFLGKYAPGLIGELKKLEAGLAKEDLYTLIKREYVARNSGDMKVVSYSPEYYNDFRRMNLSWLEEYVGVTTYDREILSDPEKMIINKGGEIWMGIVGRETIGTFILMPLDEGHVELSKFTVDKNYRRLGLGTKLLDHVLEAAKISGFSHILLYTHDNLTEAIDLYKMKGFEIIQGHSLLKEKTGRPSVAMEFRIN